MGMAETRSGGNDGSPGIGLSNRLSWTPWEEGDGVTRDELLGSEAEPQNGEILRAVVAAAPTKCAHPGRVVGRQRSPAQLLGRAVRCELRARQSRSLCARKPGGGGGRGASAMPSHEVGGRWKRKYSRREGNKERTLAGFRIRVETSQSLEEGRAGGRWWGSGRLGSKEPCGSALLG